MNQRSKILTGVFLLLVLGAIAWNYDQYLVARDYVISDLVSCDPAIESCFISICEEGDEECDDTPYKKLEKQARFAQACSPYVDDCPELSCNEGEVGCIVQECSEDLLEGDERCSDVSDVEEEEDVEEEDTEDGEDDEVIPQ